MSFWLDDPCSLINNLNIFPSENQEYSERMNSLTRLILVIAVVMFLLKIQGSGQLLIFGLLFVIILYSTQKGMIPTSQQNQSEQKVRRQNFQLSPQGNNLGSIEQPDIPGVQYSHKYGPPHLRYRQPIDLPYAVNDAKAWGGYFSILNEPQPVILSDTNYESTQFQTGPLYADSKISWTEPSLTKKEKANFHISPHSHPGYMLNGMSGLASITPEPSILDQEGLNQVYLPPPQNTTMLSSDATPQSDIPSFLLGASKSQQRDPNSVLSLGVDGIDDRFQGGNDDYIYHRSVHDPSIQQDFIQPINNNTGLMPDHLDRHQRYDSFNPPLSYDPRHASQHLLKFRDMDGFEPDTGPYRSKPTMMTPYAPQRESYGDGYRAFTDLHGNNQYFYTRVDPFPSGMFITKSTVDHLDHMNSDGSIVPRYERDGVTVQDFMDVVLDRQTADELYFRDSMASEAIARMNEREAQLRMAPTMMTPLAKPSRV
jgi:hypothetical protein